MTFAQQFSDKVVAITGGASGIGLATAHLLAERGAKLSLADVQEKALQQAQSDINSKYPESDVLIFTVDVRNYEQVDKWITETVKHFGKLDGAANLAGIIPNSIGLKGIDEQDFDEWDLILSVNLTGVMHCLKAQLRVIENTGAIVNASSIAGLIGRNKNASYVASKHGVMGLTRSAAKEVGPKGIRVNGICPYDISDKKDSKIISRTSYEGATFTNQGWVNDVNWQEWLFMDDEYDEDELAGPAANGYPVTYIWDISSLEKPLQKGLFKHNVKGIDHNQYVVGDLLVQSNYGAGVRVWDISSVVEDPTGNSVCEIAYFDIYPEDDSLPGGGAIQFSGTWSSYAYFKSGFIFVNTIERGAYLVKMTKKEACKPKTCNADNCLRALRASSVPGRLEQSREFCGEFTKTVIADVSVVPAYAAEACPTNVISRVSSACSCLPTPTA
ncbi:hypothetical protein COL922a_012942 [Colletotrichum nupharicola]|nr:hypothetical protein COL922a_012942 [Colletotrichum nupharicola]